MEPKTPRAITQDNQARPGTAPDCATHHRLLLPGKVVARSQIFGISPDSGSIFCHIFR